MTGNDQWAVVWNDPSERLFVERQRHEGGTRHRFRSNAPGDGAVIVPVRDDGRVLFIDVHRPVVGRTLCELPRGQADSGDAGPMDTARRELLEETGHRVSHGSVLGTIHPDSGLCGDGVHVVSASVVPERVEESEFPRHRWLSAPEIKRAISTGEIRDAITLAALALAEAAPAAPASEAQ